LFGFLKTLFNSKSNDDAIDVHSQHVTLFMHACKPYVEQRDLMIPRKYTLFYVYTLGAVMASLGDAADETLAYAILLEVIPRTSTLEKTDISSMLGTVTQQRNSENGQQFFAAGENDFHAWKSKQANVSQHLAKMLVEA